MLPPIPPSTLETNPQFALLHRSLVTGGLLERSDASTVKLNATYRPVEDELQRLRLQRAKAGILVAGLTELVLDDKLLDGETKEQQHQQLVAVLGVIVELIAHSFSADPGGLSEADYGLIEDKVALFRERIGDVVLALEVGLGKKCAALTEIASASVSAATVGLRKEKGIAPPTTTSTTRTTTGDGGRRLEEIITQQAETLQTLRDTTIPTALYSSTNTLISLLNTQAEHLQLLIRHLELRKHGAESRHLVAKAQFLSTVAQGLEAKARVMLLERKRDLYSSELRQSLEQRMKQIRDEEGQVEGRRRTLESILEDYAEVGMDVMRTLATRYAEIEREREVVKLDVERLEKETRRTRRD